MEKKYFIINRRGKAPSIEDYDYYVSCLEVENVYVVSDYLKAIRFENKEVALGVATELSNRNKNFTFYVFEVQISVFSIED